MIGVLAALIALTLSSGLWMLSLGALEEPIGGSFKGSPDRDGWTMFVAKRDGWSVQFPSSWHARRISNENRSGVYHSQVRALAIANVDWPLEREDCGKNCWSPNIDTAGLPAHGIAVQIGWSYGGGFTVQCDTDTPLPLTLDGARRETTRAGAAGTPQLQLSTGFILRGWPMYHVKAWIGSEASRRDLQLLEQIVASITYKVTRRAPRTGVEIGCQA